jgi:hypothetical protein
MRGIASLALLAVLGASVLAGCGEKPQTTLYKNGKFRGKPDMRPWDNASVTYGSPDWRKGDQASWDNRVRDRAMTQNEYGRIGR